MALAEVVSDKTDGNPRYVREFITSLHAQQLIKFEHWQGAWQWDLAQIRTQEITENVVRLQATQLKQLPAETQTALKWASCISYQFDLETLAIVSSEAPEEVATRLWDAVETGLLLLLRREYQFVELGWEGAIKAEYQFAHDRVQQAIYALIPLKEREKIHWQIGAALLEHVKPEQDSEQLLDIVDQLNLGRPSCSEPSQLNRLAELNLWAGKQAKAATVYREALAYLQAGIELINLLQSFEPDDEAPEADQPYYALMLQLYLEAMEVAYLNTDFDQMERLGEVLLDKTADVLDKIKVYEVRMLAYIAQDRLHDVVTTGLSVLKLLAVRFPIEPDDQDIATALQEIEEILAGRQAEMLISLPEMSGAYRLATMRILSTVSSAAYFARPKLLPLLVFKMVTLSIKHGNAPESALGYATYGLILCGRLDEIELGYQFGQLALQLLEQLNTQKLKARTLFVINTFVNHWKTHVRMGLEPLLAIHQSALEDGDLESAARSQFIYGLHSFFTGQELSELEQKMAEHSESIRKLKQERVFQSNELYRQAVLNLKNETEDPFYLGEAPDDQDKIASLQVADAARSRVFHFYFNKLILYFLFYEYQQAVDNAAIAEQYLSSVTATVPTPLFYFYDSLAQLGYYTDALGDAKSARQILNKVEANQAKLKDWAQFAPMNHQHRYYLVEAEYARVSGKDGIAREYYDQAIALAQENQYVNEEALACELTAKFYLAKGQPELVQVYMQKAHYAYLCWGAAAKLEDLEMRHPLAFNKTRARRHQFSATTTTTTTTTSPSIYSTSEGTGALDLTSVIKASQIISGEIMLDALLSKMMAIVIENAGAQKGYFLLEENGEWVIEISGAANQDEVPTGQTMPLADATREQNPLIPGSIINYVIRSQQSVVLNDAAQEGQFANDPYIVQTKPKSVLCTPLLKQGDLIGILYLENNLATDAFTPDRLEVLNLLSTQAAISIENARFYARQIALTEAYSRFVPPEILKFLNKDSIVRVNLGDQTHHEMTVLFSDIRDFTNLSEQMTPQENFNFINAYLSRVSPTIRKYQGFIDKYMGDAIMALFSRQPEDAIQAAIEMQETVTAYNSERIAAGYEPIRIGIGLHTGRVMLGTIGEAERMEATVISDAVNLASRLEGLTKVYGASIIVSSDIMFGLENPTEYQFRFLDKVKVKGKEEPVSVCEILDGLPDDQKTLKRQTQASFERGLLNYHSKAFGEAQQYFQSVLDVNPNDEAAILYLRRVEQLIEYGVPVDWEGITILTEK